ncbi:hypothetical protein ACHAXS_005327 [Conticribra weissflogii]
MFKSVTFDLDNQSPIKGYPKDLKTIVFDAVILGMAISFMTMSLSSSPTFHFEKDMMFRPTTLHAFRFGIDDSRPFSTIIGEPEYNYTLVDDTLPIEDSSTSTDEIKFQVGDIVEVYDPNIHASYAFAAKIKTVVDSDEGATYYDILPGYGKGEMDVIKHVESSVVKELKVYTPETKAACDIGASESRHFVQCKILSHLKSNLSGNNGGWYLVSYQLGSSDALKRTKLPLSKVQRIVGDSVSEQLVVDPQ